MFEGEVAGKKPRKKRVAKAAPQLPAGRQVKPRKAKPKHDLAAQVKTLGADSLLPPEKVPTRRRARLPRPTMIPIGVLPALGGLAEAETSILMSIIDGLQYAPKKSRAKIVAALGKVFA
jgi:hypothetical protein